MFLLTVFAYYDKIHAKYRKGSGFMLLAVDVGNTNITLGVYEGEHLIFQSRLATDIRRTSDQYAAEIFGVMQIGGTDVSAIRITSFKKL